MSDLHVNGVRLGMPCDDIAEARELGMRAARSVMGANLYLVSVVLGIGLGLGREPTREECLAFLEGFDIAAFQRIERIRDDIDWRFSK